MHTTLATLLNRLDRPEMAQSSVIPWSSPVPSFGDLSNSAVASLGLNPSNREFMDERGEELDGGVRRFHTLNSLGLNSWSEADNYHMRLILDSCRSYFQNNPYDGWFKRLDEVVSATGASFYDQHRQACHLDLIPYATERKWTDLETSNKNMLLDVSSDTLGLLLRDSAIQVLLLNGQTVVNKFQNIAGVRLARAKVDSWSLSREGKRCVEGFAYYGTIRSVSSIQLSRDLLVLGYNHNLQSSFGVTKAVIRAISEWIGNMVTAVLR
jgi:hypothetical protein